METTRDTTQQNKRASGKRRRGTKPGSASFLYIERKGRMKRPIGMSQEGGFFYLASDQIEKSPKSKTKKLCKLVRPEERKNTTEPEMKL